MTIDYDPDPPRDVPVLQWGAALPMDWKTRGDGSIYMIPAHSFLTAHGNARVLWSTKEQIGTEAVGAFHLPFPDGGRGFAVRQTSGMGMVNLANRPWRRRLAGTRRWWPGTLAVHRDHVAWRDAEQLLTLWMPDLKRPERLFRSEFGLDFEMPPDHFHWPEFYAAMAQRSDFLEAVRDDDFAASTFIFLRDNLILREADAKQMLVGSDRRYGDMLGAWRCYGESYLDFFLNLGPGEPQPEHPAKIENLLASAGFLTVSG